MDFPYYYRQQAANSNTGDLNDVNAVRGISLYGFYHYAKYSGDWDFVRRHWDFLKYTESYFNLINDWACMMSWAREHGALNGIDMIINEYQGAASWVKLTEMAGDEKEHRNALYLVSRLAVPNVMKYALTDYYLRYANVVN